MDTTRVNIAYRPLGVYGAIRNGDFTAIREAVRMNHTLWGGRFNPIVVVDRESEAHTSRRLLLGIALHEVQRIGLRFFFMLDSACAAKGDQEDR